MAKEDFIEEATPAFDGGAASSDSVPSAPIHPAPAIDVRETQSFEHTTANFAASPTVAAASMEVEATPPSPAVALASTAVVINSAAEDVSWEEEKTILLFDEDDDVTAVWMVDGDGQRIDIEEFPFLIGRHPQAGICLRDNGVSRQHAHILCTDDGEYVIEDLGSVNGITVNNHKTNKVVLGDGDTVEIGDKRFAYTFHVQSSGESKSTASSLGSAGQDLAAKGRDILDTVQSKFANLKNKSAANRKTAVAPGDRSPQEKIRRLAAVFLPIIALMAGYYYYSLDKRVVNVAPPVAQDATGSAPADGASAQSPDSEGSSVAVVDKTSSDKTAEMDSPNTSAKVAQAQTGATASEPAQNAADIEGATSPNTKVDATTDLLDVTASAGAEVSSASAAPNVKVVDRPEVKEVLASTVAPGAVPAVPKPIRRSPAWSRNYIQNSLNMYLNGDADAAIRRLEILSRSSRHQQRFREESATQASRLASMHGQYQQGQNLSAQGRRDEAFVEWQKFLLAESAMFPSGASVYAQQIESEVVTEYQSAGDRAYSEGRYHDAYTSWQKAASIEPNSSAARSLAELQARAKAAYIEGYQQESVNIQEATTHWNNVVALVPSGYEYHTKAKAKLKLYRSYGTQ